MVLDTAEEMCYVNHDELREARESWSAEVVDAAFEQMGGGHGSTVVRTNNGRKSTWQIEVEVPREYLLIKITEGQHSNLILKQEM